jgi:hypothetical protein
MCPGSYFPDDGNWLVVVEASDGTLTFKHDVLVRVTNVAPAAAITGPASGVVVAAGTPVAFTGTFTDAGTRDTHTAQWSFDSATVAGTVSEASGSGSAAAAHAFATPGVYQVRLTVADDDGGVGSASVVSGNDAFVVVYDPNGGFVTGGGWINSPAGAYRADPTLAGRASFGFVSKYAKGASTPTGQTEFSFQAGSFKFHGDAYQWLVVAGAKAQYKGTGSVNGAAGYGFLLTATDGHAQGGEGVDKFRIKVWSSASGAVVYDNVLGSSDEIETAAPQAIAAGSIVIHR